MRGRAIRALSLVAALAAYLCGPVEASNREINLNVLRDKIKGGWIGHMAGVSWGGPTEFQYKGAIMPDSAVPAWAPGLINDSYYQDDVIVQMPFLRAMAENGANCDWRKFGDYFSAFTPGLAHANLTARGNLQNGWKVPASGHYSINPHCDDIDWQIESNFCGILAPGQPNAAAELAWRAGHTMNYGDGVYGGVFVAAMQAEACLAMNVDQIVETGRQAIPAGSEYRQVIDDILAWRDQGLSWEQSWQLLQDKWGNVDRCPDGVGNPFNIDAKLNGAYVLLGLLYGGADFELSTRITMRCGQDGDCNPASVGSILGTFHGASGIPSQFQSGLDTTRFFYGSSYRIDDVAAVSEATARQVLALTGGTISGSGSDETWSIPDSTVTPLILEQWPITSNSPPTLMTSLVAQSKFTVTLTAAATDSDGIGGYQWFFGDMSFANGATVTHTYLQPGTYSVVCYAADSVGNTSSHVLTVDASEFDTTPPALVAMTAMASNEVLVSYSEPVEATSATNGANYAIDQGVTISQLVVGSDSKTVFLTTSPLESGKIYTCTVSGVEDLATPPNTLLNSRAAFSWPPAAGVSPPSTAGFWLSGARPNPARGDLVLSFALSDGRGARLEVVDMAGRRIWAREVGALGPGAHNVRVAAGLRHAPGVYVARLTRGKDSISAKVAWME